MKKEIMTKWVKALRSGKYKQGIKKLKGVDNSYCCLGVLCEISGVDKWNEILDNTTISGKNITYGPSSPGLPPPIVSEWAGFKGPPDGGKLRKYYKQKNGDIANRLIVLNDGGLSFKQIANIIEKNYKDL